MTEDDIIKFVTSLPGVDATRASKDNGAPEAAWGHTFFFYDPDRDQPADHRMPFATIVTSNYDGFDEASELNRPGVYRLNIAVGRQAFQELLGYRPGTRPDGPAGVDYAALDRLMPHPVYAGQAWVSILNPGAATSDQVVDLLTRAHARAVRRHRPRR